MYITCVHKEYFSQKDGLCQSSLRSQIRDLVSVNSYQINLCNTTCDIG